MTNVKSIVKPGTHLDAAYLFLNFALYSVHSYSTHFINKRWNLSIADYGYVNSMGIFYMMNIPFGILADRYKKTRAILITNMAVSTLIYLLFLLPERIVLFGKWQAVIIFTAYIMAISPVFPLIDTLVLNYLRESYPSFSEEMRKEQFSRIRLWASFGHAAIGSLISYVSNNFQDKSAMSEDDLCTSSF